MGEEGRAGGEPNAPTKLCCHITLNTLHSNGIGAFTLHILTGSKRRQRAARWFAQGPPPGHSWALGLGPSSSPEPVQRREGGTDWRGKWGREGGGWPLARPVLPTSAPGVPGLPPSSPQSLILSLHDADRLEGSRLLGEPTGTGPHQVRPLLPLPASLLCPPSPPG